MLLTFLSWFAISYLLDAHDTATYDYIVIGSATGGVVASRLAQQHYKVLLIEAGPDDETYSCKYDNDTCVASPHGDLIPGTPLLIRKSEWFVSYNGGKDVKNFRWDDAISMPSFWNYNKTLLRRSSDLLRAKMLGGCLSHNGQFWLRGLTADFDYIAQKYNLSDWSYQNVLPFFQQSETYFGPNKTLRGTNGPIEVRPTILQKWQYQAIALLNATLASGVPYNNHQNGGGPSNGISVEECNFGEWQNGKLGLFDTKYYRSGSAQNYIRDIGLKTGYLTLWTSTIVQRILFDNAINKNAIGVEYYEPNTWNLKSVYCKKEVILSAGTNQSPQLLMLSGIGPIDQLNKFNITPIYVNHYIGTHGQEHMYFFYNSQLNMRKLGKLKHSRPTTKNTITKKLTNAMAFLDDIYAGLNIFLSSGTYDRLGLDYNDIRIWTSWAGGKYTNKFRIGIDPQLYSRNLTIELKSKDARIYPNVYQNFFSDSRDYNQMLHGIFAVRKILFNKNDKNNNNNNVFVDKFKDLSKEQWRHKIWTETKTAIHAIGTVPMGYDSIFPIDSKCSVRGVNKLRVIDISIWPESTNGGTQSLAYMIGEKCTKYIIDDNINNEKHVDAYEIGNNRINHVSQHGLYVIVPLNIFICLLLIVFLRNNGVNKLLWIRTIKAKGFIFLLGAGIIYSLLCWFYIFVFNNQFN